MKPILYFIYIGRYKREGYNENNSFHGLLTQQMMNKEYQKALDNAWVNAYHENFPKVKNILKSFFNILIEMNYCLFSLNFCKINIFFIYLMFNFALFL